MNTITCPSCGEANEPGGAFCTGCGSPLANAAAPEPVSPANVCANCGTPFEEGAGFCMSCGNPLQQGTEQMPPVVQAVPVAPAASMQPVQPQAVAPKGSGGIPMWLIAAIAAVIVILLGLIVFFAFRLAGNSNSAQSASSASAASSAAATATSASSASATSTSSKSSTAASTTSSSAASSSKSSQSASAQGGAYVLADSNSRYYSRSELEKLSLLDLYHARNEIYARHGRGFKKDDLQSYFKSKSWYHETVSPDDFDEGVLNEYEKANANLMLEIEKSKDSPYL